MSKPGSDAPIRAALDAAKHAAWPNDEGIYDDAHDSAEAMIAAAIAAFLRALPSVFSVDDGQSDAGFAVYGELTWHPLAAAVERAAAAAQAPEGEATP